MGLLARRPRRAAPWRPGAAASRRASIAVAVVLVAASGVAIFGSRAISQETASAKTAARASDLYQEARFWAARQDAKLNEYLMNGDPNAKDLYEEAAESLTNSLTKIESVQDAPAIRGLLDDQRTYTAQAVKLFALADSGDTETVDDIQRFQTEPILDRMTEVIAALEAQHHAAATAQLEAVRVHAAALDVGTPSVLALVLLLLLGLSSVSRAYRRNVEEQALHDALTGLPNRTLFADRAAHALRSAARAGAQPAVIMLDLDRFKEVNDTLGHHQGDQLLIEVAARIAAVLRPTDTVARLGGDEFAVLLADGGLEGAHRAAARIAEALEASFTLDGVTVSVEASLGVSAHDVATADSAVDAAARAAELLRHADMAMYDAKMGHTGISDFRGESEGARPARLALLGELREALNRDELVLHYQPKVAAGSGQLLGVEALVRWQHPTQGLLPPSEFIPVAEATTLIQRLTLIVVDKALAMSREWLDRGVRMPVAVNVSARSLLDLSFPDAIAAALARAGVPPGLLCLELTESTIMHDPDRALSIMQDLRTIGVRLSVDDFGTGYSSMAYLKILPVDELKVDRSFVSQMNTSIDDTMLVQSAIDLGHNLGMSVVAEGVEDKQTLLALKDLGADVIQGYYLGRPMDEAVLQQWVVDRTAAEARPVLR
ncbi:MAG: bifunctional diguanylate cyclase/phosphodiesterase [Actinomycetota bacterium]|nr:bifunctional diguanylate cyclase/phosphodiesterase [Actinomycetota bacterium]